MKLILKDNVEKLGKMGAVVNVADGYGRNYLLPKGLAMLANKGNMKEIDRLKKMQLKKEEKLVVELKELAVKLASNSYTINKKVGEEGKLFGSVTKADIADVLAQEGFSIDKKKILLDEPIHTLGVFPVKIKLYHDVETEVKIWVVEE